MADFSKIIELSDDKLKSLHKNLHGDISDPAVLEAHHLVTTELTRREINHGHIDDEWAFAQIEVDSVSSVDLEDVTTEISDELAVEVAKKIGISGDVRIMLGVDGYEMQIEKSLEQDEEDLTKETFEKTIKRRGGKYVVLSEDGDREFGTYNTRREAEARLAQIERFKDMDKAEGHSPPESVREAAQRALDWISEGKAGQGFTSVGRARARQLASGQSTSVDTLKRMRSFFARHIVDKKAEGFSRGEKGYPSPGKVAWDAWGGDAGRAWAESILDKVEKSDYPEMYDPDEGLNNRQQFLYTTLENIVSEFGAFNAGEGADGAHYMDEKNNPFADDGLNCANCVFFQGGGGCEILNVEVAPMGVCKFWIIPEKLVVAKHATHDQSTHGSWAGNVSRGLTTSILERVKTGGGLSVNMVDGSEPKSGFMVAVKIKKPVDVSADNFYNPEKGRKILSDFVKSNKQNLATGKNYLGLWHNRDNNRVYLDVSQNVQDRATAVRLGSKRNQISIWDVANFAEIETGGTGVIKRKRDSWNSVARESSRNDRRTNRGVGGQSLRPVDQVGFDGNQAEEEYGLGKSESESQRSGNKSSRDLESDDQRREEVLGSQDSEELIKHETNDKVNEDELEKIVSEETIKSLGSFEMSKAVDERKFTLGPMYIPYTMDAHNEWTDDEELQQAVWKYVQSGDRRIRLQHNRDLVAGEWVEIMTFPYETEVSMMKSNGGEEQRKFPKNTVFLGVIWEDWAWDKIKKGEIRGYSIGGKAERMFVDLEQ
jgi:hypothetical protein